MDPLTAVGFAANILQFIECVYRVVKVGKQLRRHGETEFSSELERFARLLEHQVARLQAQQGHSSEPSGPGSALNDLAEDCKSIAGDILSILSKFRIERDQVISTPNEPSDTFGIRVERDIVPQTFLRRPKSDDESKLEDSLRGIEDQVDQLTILVQRRHEEEKAKRKADAAEEKKRRKKRKSDFAQSLNVAEGHEGNGQLENINLKVSDENEQDPQSPNSEPHTSGRTESEAPEINNATARTKHRDDIELESLHDKRRAKKAELEALRKRLDRDFGRVKFRERAANQKEQSRWNAIREVKTLVKAIEIQCGKRKLEELQERLDRMRDLLSFEVMLKIQKSVENIRDGADNSRELLQTVLLNDGTRQEQTRDDIDKAKHTVLHAQSLGLRALETRTRERYDAVLEAINSLGNTIKERDLYKPYPKIVTEFDPSLKTAALHGHGDIENAVLRSLEFRRMETRELQIRERYQNTCSWVFEDPDTHKKPWSNFRGWLEQESGCYWIEGKAGSGKSTLMKFLCSDIRTRLALGKWAGEERLITASYFFWLAGTSLQKNQEGLLRSLLHSILSQRRDLIAKIFPRRYSMTIDKVFVDNEDPDIFFACDQSGCSHVFERPRQLHDHQADHHGISRPDEDSDEASSSLFTLTELKNAFFTLVRTNLQGVKICLFVDGLDEYAGDQTELLDLFNIITSWSPAAIKAVVSSRPEPTFVEGLRDCPKLRVQDLTTEDIDLYVRSRLLGHSKMQSHMRVNRSLTDNVIRGIVSKAAGVFLWVFVVVRGLLESLSDGAYPEDLEQIIEAYPGEVHDLYQHMFKRMKPSHRQEGYKLFRAIQQAQAVESEMPSALRLSYVDREQPHGSITAPLELINAEKLEARLSNFEARLRSRCCGLFEVHYFDGANAASAVHLQEGRVNFLHRTVSDFLDEPRVREVIERETRQFEIEMYERLAASVLYSFKSWDFFKIQTGSWATFAQRLGAMFVYCQQYGKTSTIRQVEYINELDRQLTYLWDVRSRETRSKSAGNVLGDYNRHWAESVQIQLSLNSKRNDEGDALLHLAARYGLSAFIQDRLQRCVQVRHDYPTSVLEPFLYRLCSWIIHDRTLGPQWLGIFEKTLASGMVKDRSSQPYAKSIWRAVLRAQSDHILCKPTKIDTVTKTDTSTAESFRAWVQIIILVVKYCGNLDISLGDSTNATEDQTARGLIQVFISATDPTTASQPEDIQLFAESRHELEQLLINQPAKVQEKACEGKPAPSRTVSRKNAIHTSQAASSETQEPLVLRPRDDHQSAAVPPHRLSKSLNGGAIERGVSSRKDDADSLCSRCDTIDELASMGFSASDCLLAIQNAGVGHDTAALVNWMLNKQDMSAGHRRLANRVRPVLRTADRQPAPLESSRSFPSPVQRQWSVVKSSLKLKPQMAVVGADYVEPSPRRKQRRGRAIEATKLDATGSRCGQSASGAIEVGRGTFTWFFEPKEHGHDSTGLSEEQQASLKAMLESLGL